jgi:hypothetical protein
MASGHCFGFQADCVFGPKMIKMSQLTVRLAETQNLTCGPCFHCLTMLGALGNPGKLSLLWEIFLHCQVAVALLLFISLSLTLCHI